ncbi:MAG TPA: hypothetical protein VF384_11965 [Planctomycetota bacterium]
MNAHDEDDGDRDDPVMDWALGERLGGERKPDLVAGVRERMSMGHVVVEPERPQWTRVWVAAAALLGIAVVVALATWPKGPESRAAPAQQPAEVAPVQVSTVADVEGLPVTTRAVEVVNGNDDVIAALKRLRDLEVLVVREPWNEAFGLSPKMAAPVNPHRVTPASWASVFALSKLRRIEISGAGLMTRIPAAGLAGFANGLESKPLLEALAFRFVDTSSELLAILDKARNLRSLDLSFNHGFDERWIDAVLKLRGLRALSLKGCQQVQATEIARLQELPELEQLDVGRIDGINWRNDGGVDDTDTYPIFKERLAVQGARWALLSRGGLGPTDDALEGLAKCPRLRVLDIASGRWSSAGLTKLGECRTLRVLNAFGGQDANATWVAAMPRELERLEVCGNYTDAFCAEVATHLPQLRHLTIAACDRISDQGIAAISAMRSLRVLDMRQMRGLTAACVDSLANATWLEEIDLRHCDFVTAEHVERLRGALPNLKSLHSSVPGQPRGR